METTRIDRISKLFAQRRLSRRQAMQQGAAGLAAAGLAAAGLKAAAAQDATPATVAAEDANGVPFLFVQTFGAGSLAPKDGEEGTLTLTADHLAGQTVYFSDRPERIVGMVDTARFLGTGSGGGPATPGAGLGFSASDPPNAALVFAGTEGDDGPGNVLVVELIDPTYDPATGRATYDVKVLADETAVGLSLLSEPLAAADGIREFGAASLFIDDCPDGSIQCMTGWVKQGEIAQGYCYDWTNACCSPCVTASMLRADAATFWTDQCSTAFPDGCGNGACWGKQAEWWACG